MSRILLTVAMASLATVVSADEVPYCKDSRAAMAPRCFVALANSGPKRDQINLVMVDNTSTIVTNEAAADLVLTADRSMASGSPNLTPRKGLMKNGDRVCVTNNYLAWFDFGSSGEGFFRTGVLSGLWSLDATTKNFRYLRPSPDGSGDRWAHNQLIPGSASVGGERYHWDTGAPPIEHSFVLASSPLTLANLPFYSYHYAKTTVKSEYMVTVDGMRSSVGVHYASQSYMTSWHHTIDTDNPVLATIEYVCRPDDILVIWRLVPTKADLVLRNIYVALWLGYANDEDDTSCDVLGPGNHYPDRFYGQPLYARSSDVMHNNWDFTEYSPGKVEKLYIQPTCNRRGDGSLQDYDNHALTYPVGNAPPGSWMQVGETADMVSGPHLQLTLLELPGSGQLGTSGNPRQIIWLNSGLANENYDGTLVFGPGTTGPITTLKAHTWYQSAISLKP